jgi:tryptophan synthase alpha chain
MKIDTGTGAACIERAIRNVTAGGRPALAAFLTAGFPDPETFRAVLASVAEESDIVEIGVPFSDPMADGVTIQRSSRAALEAGVTLPWILEVMEETRPSSPIVLMSYLNPLLAFGIERLARAAPDAGVSGLIVPDLPYEESHGIRKHLDATGTALVQLVTPVTPGDRLIRLCHASRGFVYAVTMTGTTGGMADDGASVVAYLDRVRAASQLPVLAGFGIRTAAQVQIVHDHADGVIVGSALVEVLERGEDPAAFLRTLREPLPERQQDQ